MLFLPHCLHCQLIPTKLHQVVNSTLGIDIYSEFTALLFDKLEDNIVAALTKIIETVEKDDQRLVLAVVSHASTQWIQQCLDADVAPNSDGPIKLSKLGIFLYGQ